MYGKDRWSQEIIPFLDHYMAAMRKDERGELETKTYSELPQDGDNQSQWPIDLVIYPWLLGWDSSNCYLV